MTNSIQFFSSGQQDMWAIHILNQKHNGFFLELGASNGIENSDTYALEKYFGWGGICVEPTPSLYEELIKNRKCFCDNNCIDEIDNEIDFIIADGPIRGLGGIKNCIRHPDKVNLENTCKMYTTTLVSVLQKYNSPHIIDYFSLDSEGSEYRILKSFPLEDYRFRCISVEMGECDELLTQHGYEKVSNPFRKKTLDSLFVDRKLL